MRPLELRNSGIQIKGDLWKYSEFKASGLSGARRKLYTAHTTPWAFIFSQPVHISLADDNYGFSHPDTNLVPCPSLRHQVYRAGLHTRLHLTPIDRI